MRRHRLDNHISHILLTLGDLLTVLRAAPSVASGADYASLHKLTYTKVTKAIDFFSFPLSYQFFTISPCLSLCPLPDTE